MKALFLVLMLATGGIVTPMAQAQTYDTPPFNFDRSMDQAYVDSLVRATHARLNALARLLPTASVDTARMEFLHFIAYVHYSGMAHRDSTLLVANQLSRMADQLHNPKYQIKALLLMERYYRAFKMDYPRAIQLNYRLLSVVDANPKAFRPYYWRIYRNLGNINTALDQPAEAMLSIQKSIHWFANDPKGTAVQLADLHQLLANTYQQRKQLDKAETHYLLAWSMVNRAEASLSSKAYLTNEIGRLYNSRNQPDKALSYLKQSVAYWQTLHAPLPQADALADLAETYVGLRQYPKAIATANVALAQNKQVHATRLTAYAALIRAYEHQQNWKQSFLYQQLFNRTQQEQQQAINQAESLRSNARLERERVETTHRQERLRLNLVAQEKLRRQLIWGLSIISLLGILLLYYSLQLRRTNGRLLAKNREIQLALLKGQTLERKRVATELHDRVSSLLGATKMTFQTIDTDTLLPRNKQLYESSLTLLNDAATQVRELSHNLIPEQLLQQDLSVSLRILIRKLSLTGKTVFSINNHGAGSLTPEATFNLYIVCLELCTNILRHAEAKEAYIWLERDRNHLLIRIKDNGVGFAEPSEPGMGHLNVRERAEAIGAEFWLESIPNRGTTAHLKLPL